MRAVGGFRRGDEGSQDHDLALRLTEGLAARQVVHLPHVLCHWRMGPRSTASASAAKPYTADAGLRAVQDALARRGARAEVTHAVVPHCYRVERALPAEGQRHHPDPRRGGTARHLRRQPPRSHRLPGDELLVAFNDVVQAASAISTSPARRLK